MRLSDFVFDKGKGIFVSGQTDKTIHYRDGGEKYLYEVLSTAGDRGIFSRELQSAVKDWPSLYHFSPYRSTLLECLEIGNRTARVLELGAGCGAVTRWLGENFQEVIAVEGSLERTHLIHLRCSDLPSVKAYAANFFQIDPEPEFDLVTSIGVLEYSHVYHPRKGISPQEAALDLLRFAYRFLKAEGIFLLAIENKFGLKYFSGAREDHTGRRFEGIEGYPREHTAVTWSRRELSALLREAGFTALDFLLPFPDYKLPNTIVNDRFLQEPYFLHNWLAMPFPDRHPGERQMLFNESLAVRGLIQAGLLGELANSFLVLAYKGKKQQVTKRLMVDLDTWAVKYYNYNRHPAFGKRLTLQAGNPPRIRVERVQSPPAAEELQEFQPFIHHPGEEEFQAGDLLVFQLFNQLSGDRFEADFRDLLQRYQTFLRQNFGTELTDTAGFPLLDPLSLDATFWNIVIAPQTGEWQLIDLEWLFNGYLPLDFVVWRNLHHLVGKYFPYFQRKQPFPGLEAFVLQWMKRLFPSYDEGRLPLFQLLEKTFQIFARFGRLQAENFKEEIPEQMLLLAEYFIEIGNVKFARHLLEILLEWQGNLPQILNDLAVLDMLEEDFTTARERLETVLQGDPEDVTARENLDYLEKLAGQTVGENTRR